MEERVSNCRMDLKNARKVDSDGIGRLLNHALIGRVRNPKNQPLQIEPPTIVGCSLWYPIARSTMKPEARLLSSQKYRF